MKRLRVILGYRQSPALGTRWENVFTFECIGTHFTISYYIRNLYCAQTINEIDDLQTIYCTLYSSFMYTRILNRT